MFGVATGRNVRMRGILSGALFSTERCIPIGAGNCPRNNHAASGIGSRGKPRFTATGKQVVQSDCMDFIVKQDVSGKNEVDPAKPFVLTSGKSPLGFARVLHPLPPRTLSRSRLVVCPLFFDRLPRARLGFSDSDSRFGLRLFLWGSIFCRRFVVSLCVIFGSCL